MLNIKNTFKRNKLKVKIHFRNLHAQLCGIFYPNAVNVARYASLIWAKSPTNCDAHLAESNFQTRFSQKNFKKIRNNLSEINHNFIYK